MAKITQGTQIYFIDTDSNETITEITGVTNFNPGGNPADQIETTPLSAGVRSYVAGLRTPGQASMTINADPTDTSHITLHGHSESDPQPVLKFAIGWSDGTADPSSVDSNGDFVLPTSRTWITFSGYIADFPFDFSQNTVVTSNLSIQRSGAATLTAKV